MWLLSLGAIESTMLWKFASSSSLSPSTLFFEIAFPAARLDSRAIRRSGGAAGGFRLRRRGQGGEAALLERADAASLVGNSDEDKDENDGDYDFDYNDDDDNKDDYDKDDADGDDNEEEENKNEYGGDNEENEEEENKNTHGGDNEEKEEEKEGCWDLAKQIVNKINEVKIKKTRL